MNEDLGSIHFFSTLKGELFKLFVFLLVCMPVEKKSSLMPYYAKIFYKIVKTYLLNRNILPNDMLNPSLELCRINNVWVNDLDR